MLLLTFSKRSTARRRQNLKRENSANRPARYIFRGLLATGAVLLVDDLDAVPLSGRKILSNQRRQIAELDYVTSSRAAAQSLAENYVGLPMD